MGVSNLGVRGKRDVFLLSYYMLQEVRKWLVLLPGLGKDWTLVVVVLRGRVGVAEVGIISISMLPAALFEWIIIEPHWRHRNIDCLAAEHFLEIRGAPCLAGFPARGRTPHNEGRVSGDISHELEGTGFFLELLDGAAVELVIRGQKLCDGIRRGLSLSCLFHCLGRTARW